VLFSPMIFIGMYSAYSSENDLHKSVVKWLGLELPRPHILHHSANEGRGNKVQWYQKLKTLGFKSGWPDLEIFVRNCKPIFIELKKPGNYLSAHQKNIRESLEHIGLHYFVCHSLAECHEALAPVLRLANHPMGKAMLTAEQVLINSQKKEKQRQREMKKKLAEERRKKSRTLTCIPQS